jgi:hypothetical protein
MRQALYMIRSILLVWTILVFVYLNRKTTDNIGLVEEFKFEELDRMMNNIITDSVHGKERLDILGNETARFTGEILEDSSHVREGVLYLMGTFALFIVIEVSFFITGKRKGNLTNR